MVELQKIATEQRNPNTMNIDTLSTLDMVKLINQEDHRVAEAVGLVTDKIAQAVDVIAQHLSSGGRLIYCGAGTSGRLGILDAVECPPTYSTEPEMVQALMAGGYGAIFKAVEGAEDSRELGAEDMKQIHFCQKDVLVGIAASGRTPYVLGCMAYAKELGAATISVTCCPGSELDQFADIGIAPSPGPEVVTGSTRMKSGTAQKMVLNMLSTGAMIKLGKVYGNLMVDVKPSNEKLVRRCVTIVCSAAECSEAEAVEALEKCGYRPKVAIVMILRGVDAESARRMLDDAQGRIARVLEG
ncbi:MAG: N-acetylmuramic acid 6-phosphate etherase [Candidatus Faecousia sp.]|nr:N-acetylmuramic acid 6-phosphate etherase [Candidatus Faecousia sp.]